MEASGVGEAECVAEEKGGVGDLPIDHFEKGTDLTTRIGGGLDDFDKVRASHHFGAIFDEFLGDDRCELFEDDGGGGKEEAAVGEEINHLTQPFAAAGIDGWLGEELIDLWDNDAGVAVNVGTDLEDRNAAIAA